MEGSIKMNIKEIGYTGVEFIQLFQVPVNTDEASISTILQEFSSFCPAVFSLKN
jgi:hypothetical protein